MADEPISKFDYLSREINWMDRFYTAEIQHNKEIAAALRVSDQLALEKALSSSKELTDKQYATKADLVGLKDWQSKITGGLLLLGVIGVSLLVKTFLG